MTNEIIVIIQSQYILYLPKHTYVYKSCFNWYVIAFKIDVLEYINSLTFK